MVVGCATSFLRLMARTLSLGPPLDKIGPRAYVAGRPNSRDDLELDSPISKRTRSNTYAGYGCQRAGCRDIAAYLYLYTLRR
jgi:hypothetical protein